jgi:hypothetical protein
MKEHHASLKSEVGPDLFEPPHVLPALMELLANKDHQFLSQREQLLAHLATCYYCRTAVIFLLSEVLEYDYRNNNNQEPAQRLLLHFADIDRAINAHEAHQYERMGAYAESIVYEGEDQANLRFPDIAAHLKVCSDCRSALEATIVSVTESEETP